MRNATANAAPTRVTAASRFLYVNGIRSSRTDIPSPLKDATAKLPTSIRKFFSEPSTGTCVSSVYRGPTLYATAIAHKPARNRKTTYALGRWNNDNGKARIAIIAMYAAASGITRPAELGLRQISRETQPNA